MCIRDRLGCEAERRGESIGHFAWRWIRDVAFAEAAGGDDAAFDAARARVQTSLAKVLFAQDVTLMGRLTDIDERIKKDGLDVLASADAKGFRALSRAPPTFADMDAGTFARALSAEAGRKSKACLLYTSPSPRDATLSRMPSSA